MTLLFMDGFEGQDGNAIWDVYSTIVGYSSTTAFSYGQSFNFNNTITALGKRYTASTDVYCGFRYRIATAMPASTLNVITFYGDVGVTAHVVMVFNNNGSVDLKRGSTTVASAAASTILLNAWNYFEIHVKISDTVGVFEVKMNGSVIATFSGDTKNAGTNTTSDMIQFGGSNGTNSFVDDLYICDGLGSVNNTYLGERRIYTLIPTGAGASTGLTPSTGSNFQTVDEAPASATDYSGSSVTGTRDSYAMTDLPGTPASISGVALVSYAHKSDAGAASLKPVIRVGSTNYYGTTRVLTPSMIPYTDLFETSPASSSAWTASEINNGEIGGEVG